MNGLKLSRDLSRKVDEIAIEDYGIPGVVLMENAGRGVAETLLNEKPTGPISILCGKGNNGGDGFVVARHLEAMGINVSVYIFESPDLFSPDAKTNYEIIRRAKTPIHRLNCPAEVDVLISSLEESEWIVDALLGTGVRGRAREPYITVIHAVNSMIMHVLSVDVPSGLDCDAGPVVDGTIRADITATMVAPKLGMLTEHAENYVGKIQIVDIGLPKLMCDQLKEPRLL